MRPKQLITGILAWLPIATHAQSDLLTIERIIASPSLSGPSIRELKISPDGQRVTFLQGKMDDREQLDLWEYHVGEAERRLLVDSGALVAEEILSEEEKARRERQRLGGLRGIVDYSWSDNGDGLLIPLGGDRAYEVNPVLAIVYMQASNHLAL